MASTQCLPVSFLGELLGGTHDFGVAGDTFYLALYSSSATLNSSTTVYTTTNEVTGTNYVAGGNALTNQGASTSGTTAYTDFADCVFTNVTITARYGLIYNSTEANKAVAVLDFGTDKTATGQTMTIVFPAAGASTAIIQIVEN